MIVQERKATDERQAADWSVRTASSTHLQVHLVGGINKQGARRNSGGGSRRFTTDIHDQSHIYSFFTSPPLHYYYYYPQQLSFYLSL